MLLQVVGCAGAESPGAGASGPARDNPSRLGSTVLIEWADRMEVIGRVTGL